MDCLVTGGAGFIGSNLVDALIARGDRVTVIDNLSTGKAENLEKALAGGARLEVADVADAEAVAALFAVAAPELVFHLAAQIDVRHSVRIQPGTRVRTSSGRSPCWRPPALRSAPARLQLDRWRLVRRRRGAPDPGGLADPPAGALRAGQARGRGLLRALRRLHGLSTVSLRYGNVYGPRQDVHGEAGVVAIFCGA